jgi:hypothetical protein
VVWHVFWVVVADLCFEFVDLPFEAFVFLTVLPEFGFDFLGALSGLVALVAGRPDILAELFALVFQLCELFL